MSCPQGHAVPANTKFCPSCGSKIVAAAPQPGACSCGVSNAPSAKFCCGCGKSLTGAAPAQSAQKAHHLPSYQPPDHTVKPPTVPVVVGQTEKPRGLPKYRPPDHTGPTPVVREVTDGCYEGKYGETIATSGK